MKKFFTTGLLLFSIFILTAIIAFAAVPQLINYQGRLLDSAGDPVNDGLYHIKFAIYDAPTDGTELWADTFRKVGVANGLFNVALGDMSAYPLPHNLFTDTSLYLGVTIQGESEMTPRTRLLTVPFSYHSLRADSAESVDWTDIEDMPAGFADGTDDVGTGDITDVTAGTALNGGGSSGSVTLNLDTDISSNHTFNGTFRIGDSTFRADNTSIRIGDGGLPTNACLVQAERSYNTDLQRFGYYSKLTNQSTGWLHGAYLETNQSGPSGLVYGIISKVYGNGVSRYGIYSSASMNINNYTGTSFGISAIAKHGEKAYGIYATASDATTNYAGYFYGNVHVSGILSKSGGSFKIDHPLDPEHKYLQHSFIESPDMMNIYNGNVITDNNGYATVIMPDYFTVLNRDFRYQLTVIGDFAQAIIAEKIIGNQFVIRTDKPNIEVSWQVTGIRHDNWANDNRIEVEIDKRPKEIGTYLHPEAFGQPIEKDVNYEHIKMAEEQSENR